METVLQKNDHIRKGVIRNTNRFLLNCLLANICFVIFFIGDMPVGYCQDTVANNITAIRE